MKRLIPLTAAALALGACATLPKGEVPIEEAQRRMPKEPPVIVADGCLYRRNLTLVNHFIVEDSRQLGVDGAKEVMAGFKTYGKVEIRQFTVPVMCATDMPPRGDEKGGRISKTEASQDVAESKLFPEPIDATVAKDEPLFNAYGRLFEACDYKRYRKEDRYDCPLLKPDQAALLKARLKTSYVVALSVGGERLSAANRGAGAIFGLLLGSIAIGSDEGTARVRVVNLDTGNLIYSSFLGDFRGQSPSGNDYGFGSGESTAANLKITDNWVKRMVKPLFDKQR